MKFSSCLFAVLLFPGWLVAQNQPVPPDLAEPEVDSWEEIQEGVLENLLLSKLNSGSFPGAKQLSDGLNVAENAVTVKKNYPQKPYLIITFKSAEPGTPALEGMAREFLRGVLGQDGYFSQKFIVDGKQKTPTAFNPDNSLTSEGLQIAFQTPPPADENEPTKQEKLEELIQNIQEQIEVDDALRGVYLASGRFVENPDMPGEILQLSGKLMDPAQGPTVEKLVLESLEADPYWRKGEGPLTISTQTMRISQGSPQVAGRLYDLALTAFWKGQYSAAEKAFSRAMAEAPTDDVIRYWSAVNALAQGQEDRAKAKLRPLVETYPQGSRTPIFAAGFERLQGPLRQQLMTLENELLLAL